MIVGRFFLPRQKRVDKRSTFGVLVGCNLDSAQCPFPFFAEMKRDALVFLGSHFFDLRGRDDMFDLSQLINQSLLAQLVLANINPQTIGVFFCLRRPNKNGDPMVGVAEMAPYKWHQRNGASQQQMDAPIMKS